MSAENCSVIVTPFPTHRGSERLMTFVTTVGAALVSLWLRYLTWQARRTTTRALHSLDDHTLRDIGLRRNEIESIVSDLDLMLASRRRAARRRTHA
jgi:uncharacterized protein YjiS (DUF1127 family)